VLYLSGPGAQGLQPCESTDGVEIVV